MSKLARSSRLLREPSQVRFGVRYFFSAFVCKDFFCCPGCNVFWDGDEVLLTWRLCVCVCVCVCV